MNINKPIVIFGASVGASKVAKILKNIGINFEFFVDNDKSKWGKEFENKVVYSPELLRHGDYQILIASDYQSEIEEQLEEMGIYDSIILKEQYIMDYIEQCYYKEYNYLLGKVQGKRVTTVIDLIEGIGLGGIETWSFMVAEELFSQTSDVYIYTKETQDTPPVRLLNRIEYFNTDYSRYSDTVHDIVVSISDKLPCTIITNWQSQVMFAGIIAKKLYPGLVSIISVLHNDKVAIYRRQQYLEGYTDKIVCVSEKIRSNMKDEYNINNEKLFYKESPVDFDESFIKQYTLEPSLPIKIGFAARIDKFQKRADLLIKLIIEMEKKNINYKINIAGIGNHYGTLKEFVDRNNLQEHVCLLGLVERDSMADFWKENDIYLSVSDFEGASISMLEGMSYGLVPVVTDVSGVNEFVENEVNGIISPLRGIDEILAGIERLENDRGLLKKYGDICRENIKKKCVKSEYIKFLLDLIL